MELNLFEVAFGVSEVLISHFINSKEFIWSAFGQEYCKCYFTKLNGEFTLCKWLCV